MPRNNSRGGRNGSKNNNPTGRNQYSDWGVMELARERPVAATAAAVGAAAAGLFLWSKRAEISNQLSNLSEQMNDWRSDQGGFFQSANEDAPGLAASEKRSGASARRSAGSASGQSRPTAVG